jgi:hypothetical protein
MSADARPSAVIDRRYKNPLRGKTRNLFCLLISWAGVVADFLSPAFMFLFQP